MTKFFSVFLAFYLLLPAAAFSKTDRLRVLTPQGWAVTETWTSDELKAPIARRMLRKTSGASYHLIRLKTSEEPHVHQEHDLSVFVLHGKSRVHLAGKVYDVRPGDVVEIPRDTPHWVENKGRKASLVYAVFTPPFDGKDQFPVPHDA